jgi:uncharacterized protein YyaL (SSP411 family)
MIAAFAESGRSLGESSFVRIATEAADFILGELRTPEGRLLRSWKDGRAQHAAVLEDHAHLADGLLALYEATFDELFFVAARQMAEEMLEHFEADEGGFHDTADDAEALIARPRDLQDNALPSGGSMATTVLLRLAALTGEGRYRTAAERALRPVDGVAVQHPTGFAQWLIAAHLAATPIDEIAIVGDPSAEDTVALLTAARAAYRPNQVIAMSAEPGDSAVPLLRDRARLDGAATAYVCRGFVCERPTTDPTELTRRLDGAPAS